MYTKFRDVSWIRYQEVVQKTKYQIVREKAKIDNMVDLCVFGESFIK